MSSPLAIQIMRFGFLVLLWLFVYGAVRVVRSDLRTAGQNRVALPPPTRRRRRDAQPPAGRRAPSVPRRHRGQPGRHPGPPHRVPRC